MTAAEPSGSREHEPDPAGATTGTAGAVAAVEPRGALFSARMFQSVREVPAYRWYILASLGSSLVMNAQIVVRGYLVFSLTGSYAVLGASALMFGISGVVFMLFGGVVADRLPKKYVMQAGQTFSMLTALAIGLLLLFDMLRVEHLLVTSFLNGAAFSLMMPARQAWLPELVGMDRLMNAVALNSAVQNSTRLIGPMGAGFLIAAVGPDVVYFAMAGLYLFSIVTLARVTTFGGAGRAAVRLPARGGESGRGRGIGRGALADIRDAFVYLVANRLLLMLLLVNLATVLLSMPYMMLLPGWVLDVLGGGPETVGLLLSIGAIGSLGGALFVASLPNRNRGRYYLLGSLLVGVMLVAFSQSTAVWLTALVMIVMNVGSALRNAISNVLVQSHVDDEYRGRVMSIYMMQMNFMAFGAAGLGLLATAVGPQTAFLAMALALVALSASLLAFAPALRNLD